MNVYTINKYFSFGRNRKAIKYFKQCTFTCTTTTHYSHQLTRFFFNADIVQTLFYLIKKEIYMPCFKYNFRFAFAAKEGTYNVAIIYRPYLGVTNRCTLV